MSDISELLRRQTEWQRSLCLLPWPEKIRMAVRLRESVKAMRGLKVRLQTARGGNAGDGSGRRP